MRVNALSLVAVLSSCLALFVGALGLGFGTAAFYMKPDDTNAKPQCAKPILERGAVFIESSTAKYCLAHHTQGVLCSGDTVSLNFVNNYDQVVISDGTLTQWRSNTTYKGQRVIRDQICVWDPPLFLEQPPPHRMTCVEASPNSTCAKTTGDCIGRVMHKYVAEMDEGCGVLKFHANVYQPLLLQTDSEEPEGQVDAYVWSQTWSLSPTMYVH